MATIREFGERQLIERLAAIFSSADPRTEIGIGDDAAVLDLSGRLCATVDSIESGVDWLPDMTPRDAIGHRAAAISLSDLAAMGAEPAALLVALEIPADIAVTAILSSAMALQALASRHGASVVGGDVGVGTTERWTVTALGELTGLPMRRCDAKVGDIVWLLGEVGMAEVGLSALRNGLTEACFADCIERHLRPLPQCDSARSLMALRIRLAAIDVSDGLALDAGHVASASGVRLEVQLPRPTWVTADVEAACAHHNIDWRSACASGGDDYALVVCAEPGVSVPGLAIGCVVAGEGASVSVDGIDFDGSSAGWEHR